MKVVVRVRPDNDQESGSRTIISVVDEQHLIFDPKEDFDDFYFQGVKQKDFLKKSNKNMEFVFDRVFDGYMLNSEVYEHTTLDILDGLLDGFNCSIFAYGATGAGKTFTMLGNLEHPGITFLTMMDLYSRIEAAKAEKTIDVAVSYLEVYNENIRDLLSPGPNLQIREDPQRGVIVAGLKLCKPAAADDLLNMLRNGNKNRTQHPTDANAESSRSHAVFTVYVKQHDRTGKKSTKVAKMSLIDLAGSERATMVSKNRGSRMREGANINKSLLALGNCINALADRKAKAHVPYRNSKLTRLLKDSLDGNCRTIMIAAVSPSVNSYEDTYNTLKYAMRAKNIKMNLKQNVVNIDLHLNQYAKLVEELRKKVSVLEAKLQQKTQPDEAPLRRVEIVAPMPPPPAGPSVQEIRAKCRLEELFAERLALQRQYLHVVGQAQQFKLKIHRRRQKLLNLVLVSFDGNKMDKSTARADKAVGSFESRRAALVSNAALLERQLTANQTKLSEEEAAVETGSEGLEAWIAMQRLKQDIQQAQQRSKHLERIAMELDTEYDRSNSLSRSMMTVLRRQYLILKSNSLATCDVEEDYEFITKQVEGCKGVVWADESDVDEASGDDNPPGVRLKDVLNLNLASMAKAAETDCIIAPTLTALPQAIAAVVPDRVPAAPVANCGFATVIRPNPITGQSFAKLRKIDTTQIRKNSKTPPRVVPAPGFVPSELVSPRIPVGTKRTREVLRDCETTFTLSPPVMAPSPLLNQNCNQTFVKGAPTLCNSAMANMTFTETPRSPLTQTNGRRLTFDAPGPSILKVLEEKIASSPDLVAQQQQENIAALADKQQANLTLMRKSLSYQQLPSRSSSSLDFANIKTLEKLKLEGFPPVAGKTELTRELEKQKPSWGLKSLKIKAFKSAVKPVVLKPPISRGTAKTHPYQPLQAQRQKVHQSVDNLTDNSSKRMQPLRSYNDLPTSSSKPRLPNFPAKPASLTRKPSQSMSNLGALIARKS